MDFLTWWKAEPHRAKYADTDSPVLMAAKETWDYQQQSIAELEAENQRLRTLLQRESVDPDTGSRNRSLKEERG